MLSHTSLSRGFGALHLGIVSALVFADLGGFIERIVPTSPRPAGVEFVPELREGKTVGLRLIGVAGEGLFGKLGLRDGDRLDSVGGYRVTSPSEMIALYTRLRALDVLKAADRARWSADDDHDSSALTRSAARRPGERHPGSASAVSYRLRRGISERCPGNGSRKYPRSSSSVLTRVFSTSAACSAHKTSSLSDISTRNTELCRDVTSAPVDAGERPANFTPSAHPTTIRAGRGLGQESAEPLELRLEASVGAD